jgi:tRNA threonylcarbamoyladenosine biosynthesis protein TsaE
MGNVPLRLRTSSPDETRRLGLALGRLLDAGTVVALRGGLGSGKTVIARGLAEGLGCGDVARSPSFIIVNEYEGRLLVRHIDLYRLSGPDEVLGLDPREVFWGEGVALVEWAERAGDLLPPDRIEIALSISGPLEREIVIEASGPTSERAVLRLRETLGPGRQW